MYIHFLWNLGLFFVFLPTILQQACQKFNVHVQMNISQKGLLEILSVFHHIRNSSEKFSEFWLLTRMFWQDGHNYILHVQKHNLSKNNFFSKNSYIFSSLFGIWTAYLWVFRRKFFGVVVKIAFSVAKGTFLKKRIFFFKKLYFQQFWGSGKLFVFLALKLRQVCQNFIVQVRTNLLRRNNFVWKMHKFLVICGIRANTFQSFDENFSAGLSQLHSACPLEEFSQFLKEGNEGKFSIRKSCIAIFFGLWTKKILSALAGMVTAGLSKVRCTCSDEHFYKDFFSGSLSFFHHFRNSSEKFSEFWLLTRMFWQDGHNYILHVQKHNLSKNNFLSKNSYIFSSLFGIWTAYLWVFRRNFFGVVVKIAFSVTKETFLKKE